MRPAYCTREDVKNSLDVRETARANDRVDRAIQAAADSVDSLCHRVFYPHITTRYFDWPDPNRSRAWRLWLNQHDLISVSDLGVRGGASLLPASYFLEPINSGPPFTHVEIDTASGSSGSFGGGVGTQRGVRITGTWGYRDTSDLAGALAGSTNMAVTSVIVTDSSRIGVGSTIVVGTERMLVTERTLAATGATLAADVPASLAATGIQVSDASLIRVGESLLLDTERIMVDDKAGNLLLVRRSVDGSVLAAHTGTPALYAPRQLTVERGALGTSATVHNAADAVRLVTYPQLVRTLAIAEAMNILAQDQSSWARTAGSGDNEREVSGKGIRSLRDDTYWTHGRQARKMAI